MSTANPISMIKNWFKDREENEDEILSYEIVEISDNNIVFNCGDDQISINYNNFVFESFVYMGNDNYLLKLSEQMNQVVINENIIDSLNIMSNLAKIIYSDNNEENYTDNADLYIEENETYNSCIDEEFDNSNDLSLLKKRWIDKDNFLIKAINNINSNDSNNLYNNSSKTQSIFSVGASTKVLINEMLELLKICKEEGFELEAIDDNIHNWRIKFFRFSSISDINIDLMNLYDNFGYNYIEIELSFARDIFPFYPPILSLIRPKLHGFAFGRLARLSILQLSSWNPILSMKTILIELKKCIQSECRVDVSSPLNDLSLDSSYTALEQLLIKLETITEIKSRVQIRDNELVKDSLNEAKKIKLTIEHTNNSSTSIEPIESNNTPTGGLLPSSISKTTTTNNWAKGTGYGGGSYGKSTWDKQAFLAAQAEKYRLQEIIIDQIIMKLNESAISNKSHLNQQLSHIIAESCVIPFLSNYLTSISLLEIQRHQLLYTKVFQVLDVFSMVNEFNYLLGKLDEYKPSLQDYVGKIKGSLDMCLDKQSRNGAIDESNRDSNDCIIYLVKVAHNVCSLQLSSQVIAKDNSQSIISSKLADSGSSIDKATLEKEYINCMIPLQYSEISKLSTYHYQNYLKSNSLVIKSRIKRLAQEHADLSNDKECMLSWSSSVWIRAFEERMDALQVMISGPEGTPYCNGLFIFDVYFPDNYPAEPPKVNLKTTGRGTVRFNPNLYNCGKVCLSLLGTWSGEDMEKWNEEISTFRQILISIQSLILVPEPYFNEPGYQSTIGTPEGSKASNQYNSNIYFQTHRWAMLDLIENPTPGFEDIINRHFYYKRTEIKSNLDRLIRENIFVQNSYSNTNGNTDIFTRLNTALDALILPNI